MNPQRYEMLLQMAKVSPLDCLRQMSLTVDQLEILVVFINRMGEQTASDIQAMRDLVEAERDARVVARKLMPSFLLHKDLTHEDFVSELARVKPSVAMYLPHLTRAVKK